MRITALAGGVGGARFLRGLVHHLRAAYPDEQPEVTVIGNTGDDITLFGLRVCPDLDTILYTLGGGVHEGQGWGRADESHHVAAELAELGGYAPVVLLGGQGLRDAHLPLAAVGTWYAAELGHCPARGPLGGWLTRA